MSRENQIEEMEKDLLSAYAINKLYSEDVAEYLYNAGYRKVPEGAIILTKEEFAVISEYMGQG